MTTIAPTAQPSGGATRPRGRTTTRAGAVLLVGVVLLVSLVTLLLTGQPLLAVAPAAAVAVLALLWTAPLRHVLALFTGLYLVVSIPPKALPSGELGWKSPVYPVQAFLSDNLSSSTGIEALRFSGAELLFLVMLGLIAVRTLAGIRTDVARRQPAAGVLYPFLAAALLVVLWLEVWGLAHGGDFRQSLWQFRDLLWLPVLAGMFCYCMRDVRDFRVLAVVITVAAWIKIALGLQYMMFVAWPGGMSPETMTNHEDTVLFVTVQLIWFVTWLHHPTRRTFALASLANSFVLVGMVINNRRIAFVSLLAGMVIAVLMLRGPMKRRIVRGGVYAMPLIVVYLMLGRTHHTGIFKPAAQVMSVSEQKDASSKTRDIENYNLIQTLKPSKLLGRGWGLEYNEVSKAYDISQAFAQYRYIAHNSILWLLGIGGAVGFSLMWMPLVVTIFLAARSYRLARSAYDRTVASASITVMVTYLVQAWGDMGTQSVCTMLMVAAAMAAAAKLAHATGAWPSHVRLFGVPRAARLQSTRTEPLPDAETF